MTELAFHFGAPDKMAYTCRLLRKAVGSGAKVVVLASADSVAQLDVDLWGLSPTEFLPHCLANAGDAVRGRSPVVMVTDLQQEPEMADVLVNLTDTVALGFARFARVIEVVSTDAADRDLARQRWRQYTEQGYTIARHDLTLKRVD
nr:DNA polymerase III subunit chi [uncultured Rhodoferax sp.]